MGSPQEARSPVISRACGWSRPLPEALQKRGGGLITDGPGKAKSLLYSIEPKTRVSFFHFSSLKLRGFVIHGVSQCNQHFPPRTRLGFRPRSLQTLKRGLPGPGPHLVLRLPWGGCGLTWAPKHHPTPQTHHHLSGKSLPQWLEVADVKTRTVPLSRTPKSRRGTRSQTPTQRHRHHLSSRACAASTATRSGRWSWPGAVPPHSRAPGGAHSPLSLSPVGRTG